MKAKNLLINQQGLALKKRPHLTVGQKCLYDLVRIKLDRDESLLFSEVKPIYVNHVCRTVQNGVPYYFNYWWRNDKDEIVGRDEPMSEQQILAASVMWLTHNIGSLVLKGYLKVLPVLELEV